MAMDDQTYIARTGLAATAATFETVASVRNAGARLRNRHYARWIATRRRGRDNDAFVAASRESYRLEDLHIARRCAKAEG